MPSKFGMKRCNLQHSWHIPSPHDQHFYWCMLQRCSKVSRSDQHKSQTCLKSKVAWPLVFVLVWSVYSTQVVSYPVGHYSYAIYKKIENRNWYIHRHSERVEAQRANGEGRPGEEVLRGACCQGRALFQCGQDWWALGSTLYAGNQPVLSLLSQWSKWLYRDWLVRRRLSQSL